MKSGHLANIICAFVVIITILNAGCIFPQGGTPSTQVTQTSTPPAQETPSIVIQTPEMEVPNTCQEIGGTICLMNELCVGSLIKTTDSERCCSGTCSIAQTVTATVKPTETSVTPGATSTTQPVKTVTGIETTTTYTIYPTRPGATETPIVTTVQTPEMEIAKTCLEIGGNSCLADETCSGSLIKTTDYSAASRCCAGVCIMPPAGPNLPQSTPTITVIPTVAKTCLEIGGNICQGTETCSGGLIKTTDSERCCAGTCK
jgi:hypothetical protein